LLQFLIVAITCGHPGNPANGLTQGSQFNLNDVAKFVCNTGYRLEGASQSQCLANGQWSSTLPACRGESGSADGTWLGLPPGFLWVPEILPDALLNSCKTNFAVPQECAVVLEL